MNDQADAPDVMRNWLLRHMHFLILVLGLAFLIGISAVWAIDRFGCRLGASCDTLASLNRAADAEEFEAVVWQTTDPQPVEAAASAAHAPVSATVSILPLRAMMFIDSMMIVPGYLGLLLVFLVALSRGRSVMDTESRDKPWWHVPDWRLQLACALAVAAAIFDIAENGMTVRAAEDALERLLADPTVADVHLATRLKWTFIALASTPLGIWAVAASRKDQETRRKAGSWLVAGGLACAAATALLLVGEYGHVEWSTSAGAATFALELLLIGAALWKATSSDDYASHPEGEGEPALW